MSGLSYTVADVGATTCVGNDVDNKSAHEVRCAATGDETHMPRQTPSTTTARALGRIRDDAAYLRGLAQVVRRRVEVRRHDRRSSKVDAEAFAFLDWAVRQIDETTAHLYAAVKRLQRKLRREHESDPKI